MMKKRRIIAEAASLLFAAALCAVALTPPPSAAEMGCPEAMKLLDAVISGFSCWEGNFTHSIHYAALDYSEVEEGRLVVEKGGRMRWEYSSPPGKLAVSDGKTAWLYLPDEKRAYKLKIPPQKYLPVPIRLLFGKTTPSKEFFCVAASSENGKLTMELGFKEKSVNFRRLAVTIDLKEKFISGISYTDEMDNRIAYGFAGGKRDGRLDPGIFSFTPPPGVKISEELDDPALQAIEK